MLNTLASFASVKVDRVWEKYGIVTALVTYQNNELKPISEMVSIKCIVLNPAGEKVALGENLINSPDEKIPVGFTDSYEVKALLNGAIYGSLTCKDIKN